MTLYRIVFFMLLLLKGAAGLAIDNASPEASVLPDAPSTRATPVSCTSITRGQDKITADSIFGDAKTQEIVLRGHVMLILPEGTYTADTARYNLLTRLGVLDNAQGTISSPISTVRYYFRCAQFVLGEKQLRHLRSTAITTCNREVHPHYRLIARDLYLSPDNSYHAHNLSLEVAGHRLVSLPDMYGSLSATQGSRRFIDAGQNTVDGAFISLTHNFPLSTTTGLEMTGRWGTEGLFRGLISLNQQLSLPGPIHGTQLSLIASSQEMIQNPLYDGNHPAQLLHNLSVSRLPALQLKLKPITMHGFSLNLGTGWGRYHERPSGVTADRTQAWGTLDTPTIPLGQQLFAYGKIGVSDAIYPGSTNRATEETVGIKTAENAIYFLHIAYSHRTTAGFTPFIFDRIEIPQEIFTAIEMPVPLIKNGLWRIGIWNRENIATGISPDYSFMGIYQEDCMAFALAYNHLQRSYTLNVVLTALGNFHQNPTSIGFTQ